MPAVQIMSESTLEARFELAWRTMAPEGAPPCHPEYAFHPSRGWLFDFAWPEQRVAVEIDGGQWMSHGGRHSRDSDREKLNQAAVLGWRVLHYSGAMLQDPERVIVEVLQALGGEFANAVDV